MMVDQAVRVRALTGDTVLCSWERHEGGKSNIEHGCTGDREMGMLEELQFSLATRAVSDWQCVIGNWKRLGKRWRTWRIISSTFQNVKKPHPAGSKNAKI